VPLTEDQDQVGEFGSDGLDEPFGEGVCPRASRHDLHSVDTGTGQDASEGGATAIVLTPQRLGKDVMRCDATV
jgi:hypothetical protein